MVSRSDGVTRSWMLRGEGALAAPPLASNRTRSTGSQRPASNNDGPLRHARPAGGGPRDVEEPLPLLLPPLDIPEDIPDPPDDTPPLELGCGPLEETTAGSSQRPSTQEKPAPSGHGCWAEQVWRHCWDSGLQVQPTAQSLSPEHSKVRLPGSGSGQPPAMIPMVTTARTMRRVTRHSLARPARPPHVGTGIRLAVSRRPQPPGRWLHQTGGWPEAHSPPWPQA